MLKNVLTFIFSAIITLTLEWLVTCGIVKLFTLGFGWSFSWLNATVIWLILRVVIDLFKSMLAYIK